MENKSLSIHQDLATRKALQSINNHNNMQKEHKSRIMSVIMLETHIILGSGY